MRGAALTSLAFLLAAVPAAGDRLPPANPLALDESDAQEVFVPIDALFAALKVGDAAGVLAQVYPDGRVTATGTRSPNSTGFRSETWAQFAGRLSPATAFDEQISNPAIEIDGDVAMVWTWFVVRRGGKVANCGYDHFDLIRENGVWKVMNLSFSSRITDCGE